MSESILRRNSVRFSSMYGVSSAVFSAGSENIYEIRKKFSELRADIVSVKSFFRRERKTLFSFDMDSTLIEQEVIDELAGYAGVFDEVAKVTEEAMQGKLDFREALEKRCAFLSGLSADVFDSLYSKLVMNEGVPEFLSEIRKYNSVTAVFSGGFVPILEKFCRDYGITEFRANSLETVSGKLTGKVLGEIVDRDRKKKSLIELREKYGILNSDTAACGDGSNDAEMIKEAGIGLGFHAKEGLKKNIQNWMDYVPLTGLLHLYEN
ncbi:MAG TPA: phosphoserine phosphatase SerB [Leptospiraceae bacterium]|nr:phosphoserine phosphatase SerB [Leptospiraceae bacterium]